MILLLEQAWTQRTKILLIALVFMLALSKRQFETVQALRVELAEKPKVTEHSEGNSTDKKETGTVRVIEKFSVVPGKCEPVLSERTTETGPTVETKVETLVTDHAETPTCPPPVQAQHFVVGGSVDPFNYKHSVMPRAGVALGRFDLSYGHSINGPQRQAVDVAWHF